MAIKDCIARLCQVMNTTQRETRGRGGGGGGGGGSGRMVVFVSMFSPLLFFPTFIENKTKTTKNVAGSSGRIFSKSFI